MTGLTITAQGLKNVLKIAFGQSKLLREPIAGIEHFLIFWGFMLFLFAVLEAIIQGFYSPFTLSFLGPFFSAITLVQDLFGIFVLAAILVAFIRRFVIKVPRLQVGEHASLDATIILLLIALVVISMFGQNMASIAASGFTLPIMKLALYQKLWHRYFLVIPLLQHQHLTKYLDARCL